MATQRALRLERRTSRRDLNEAIALAQEDGDVDDQIGAIEQDPEDEEPEVRDDTGAQRNDHADDYQ